MTNEEKWEKVSAKSKGKSKVSTKLSKTQKQALVKSMPTVEDLSMSKKQSLMFESNESSAGDSNEFMNKPAKSKKPKVKKVVEPKVQVYKTIKEAINVVELKDFDKKVLEIQEKYADNLLLGYKEVASYFNANLNCQESLTQEAARVEGYPLCEVDKSMNDTLMKFFKKLKPDFVPHVFKYCFDEMLELVARDRPCLGYQVCLQALGFNRNQLCLSEISEERMIEDINNYQNMPKKCFFYLWAIAQTGIKDSKSAMQVWLAVMLQTLNVKCTMQFSMSFIETELKRKKPEVSVKPEQFHKICQYAFDPSDILTKAQISVKERMAKIYPVFKDAIMRQDSSKRNFFIFFLSSAETKAAHMEKMVEIAITCLQTDNYCVTFWRDNYLKNLLKTRMLVEYFKSAPEEFSKANKRKVFRETIRSFHNTNEDLIAKGDPRASHNDFHVIRKFFQQSFESQGEERKSLGLSTLVWTLLVLSVAVVVGVVAYDMNENGGEWEGCRTHAFLKQSGVLAHIQHIKLKIEHVADQVAVWYKEQLPVHMQKLKLALEPYCKVLCEHYYTGLEKANKVVTPMLENAKPYLKEHVQKPFLKGSEVFTAYALEATDNLLAAYQKLVKYLLYRIYDLNDLIVEMKREDFDWKKFSDDIVSVVTEFFAQLPAQLTLLANDARVFIESKLK